MTIEEMENADILAYDNIQRAVIYVNVTFKTHQNTLIVSYDKE